MKNKEKLQNIFVERLKELLQEKGINQAKLSKETKIPQQSISSWITCARTIQIDSLCILADYFGVTTDYLLGREM